MAYDIRKSAAAYAQQRQGYSPHRIMQEGQVTYQNGVPGIMIKYNTPMGSSTEWTPIPGYEGGSNVTPFEWGSGGAGGSGQWGIPNASAYMEMEVLAQKAWADAQARLKQRDIQLRNYYGLKSTETDKETGLTSKFEIDPQSLYGAYQQLFRQNADDYNMGQEEGMERGIYGSGLGGQILSDVGYKVGLERGTMASESVAGFGGLRDEWAQGKYNYDLETLRARLAAAQAGGPIWGPDYDSEDSNQTTSVGDTSKPWRPTTGTSVGGRPVNHPGIARGTSRGGGGRTAYEHGRGRPPTRRTNRYGNPYSGNPMHR